MTTREEMKSLTEEIIHSYEDRTATIAELRGTVKLDLRELQTHLMELRDSRLTEIEKLRVYLARSVADEKGEVSDVLQGLKRSRVTLRKKLRADLVESATKLGSEVKGQLHDFGQASAAMSKALRADLVRTAASRRREVGGLLKEVGSEIAGVREEWQKLTATMQERQARSAVEATPETATIHEQVFQYLANHPDGTRLVELEREFKLARIQIARVLGNLIDGSKVEKRQLLYFAV